MSDFTQVLACSQGGDPKAAEELLPLVYAELRHVAAHKMASERAGHTLQPTALVHEGWAAVLGCSSRRATGTIPGDASDIVEVASSGDGTLLATGRREGAVSLWDAPTRRLQRWSCSDEVMSLAFSPTEPLLVADGRRGNITFYNTTTMAEGG